MQKNVNKMWIPCYLDASTNTTATRIKLLQRKRGFAYDFIFHAVVWFENCEPQNYVHSDDDDYTLLNIRYLCTIWFGKTANSGETKKTREETTNNVYDGEKSGNKSCTVLVNWIRWKYKSTIIIISCSTSNEWICEKTTVAWLCIERCK